MLNNVSFDGVIATTSTNWPKRETRIGVSTTYGNCGEIEADSLGELAREETSVHVEICDSENTGEIIEFNCSIDGIRTDWAKGETSVTFKVATRESFESKSAVLGVWGERHIKTAISVSSNQAKLL